MLDELITWADALKKMREVLNKPMPAHLYKKPSTKQAVTTGTGAQNIT